MTQKKVLVTGKNGNISQAIVAWLQKEHDLSVEKVSLRGDEWKKRSYEEFNVVIHVAGIVPKDGVSPKDYYRINSELTRDFALKVKEDGVKHFIYISSMAVYGMEQSMDAKKGEVSKDTPCLPTSDYGKSKLQAETYLHDLKGDDFLVSIVRVPSIYGKGKTEYLDQYRHLNTKFPFIPNGYRKHYKSFIYIDNLSEILYLIFKNKVEGVFCPDDGLFSAADICKAINPKKKFSKILGWIFEKLLCSSDRVKDYYGAIYYGEDLTNCFEGKYRVFDLKTAVRLSYEE